MYSSRTVLYSKIKSCSTQSLRVVEGVDVPGVEAYHRPRLVVPRDLHRPRWGRTIASAAGDYAHLRLHRLPNI